MTTPALPSTMITDPATLDLPQSATAPTPPVAPDMAAWFQTDRLTGGTVYLLHFDRPYPDAQHYCGWTADLPARLTAHSTGRGARLIEVITAAGIGYQLARTWPGDRNRERRIKRQGGLSRCCPLCGVTPRPPRPPQRPCPFCDDTGRRPISRQAVWTPEQGAHRPAGTSPCHHCAPAPVAVTEVRW